MSNTNAYVVALIGNIFSIYSDLDDYYSRIYHRQVLRIIGSLAIAHTAIKYCPEHATEITLGYIGLNSLYYLSK